MIVGEHVGTQLVPTRIDMQGETLTIQAETHDGILKVLMLLYETAKLQLATLVSLKASPKTTPSTTTPTSTQKRTRKLLRCRQAPRNESLAIFECVCIQMHFVISHFDVIFPFLFFHSLLQHVYFHCRSAASVVA